MKRNGFRIHKNRIEKYIRIIAFLLALVLAFGECGMSVRAAESMETTKTYSPEATSEDTPESGDPLGDDPQNDAPQSDDPQNGAPQSDAPLSGDPLSDEPAEDAPLDENEPETETAENGSVSLDKKVIKEEHLLGKTASSPDRTTLAQIQRASDSLTELAAQKEIMAVVYLTDHYAMKAGPDGLADTVCMVPSASTVFIHDVAVAYGRMMYAASSETKTQKKELTEESDDLQSEETDETLSEGQDDEKSDDETTDAAADGDAADDDAADASDHIVRVPLAQLEVNTSDSDGSVSENGKTGSADEETLTDTVICADGVLWYLVDYYEGETCYTGYIERTYLVTVDEEFLAWEEEYLFRNETLSGQGITDESQGIGRCEPRDAIGEDGAPTYADVAQFPGSYQTNLTALKNSHPNWTFVPLNTGLDFTNSVNNEMGDKSLIYKTAPAAYRGAYYGSNWYYATKEAVSYYMDPRNFLTESYIFQFEQLTYNASYHTESAVQQFLSRTFMSGTMPGEGMTYAHAFFQIGKNRTISPTHLATRVYQEQGAGTSPLISGNYPGYQGYYNYFNVGASGSSDAEVIRNGLAYAKSKGWNTRYKSLEGGAATIGNGYILKGQDTGYLQKFNVNPAAANRVFTHQYMQNIAAPSSESQSTRSVYSGSGSLGSAFAFKIPVFSGMPGFGLSTYDLTMNKGTTATITPMVSQVPMNGSYVNWVSTDPSVVTVTNGVVTAIRAGQTVIKATYDGTTLECRVTVKAPLQAISLDKSGIELQRADSLRYLKQTDTSKTIGTATGTLHVSYDPIDTTDNRAVTWTSSNSNVVKITCDMDDAASGILTAVGVGTATVTAQVGTKKASCTIVVTAPIGAVGLTLHGGKLDVQAAEAEETSDQVRTVTMMQGDSVNLIHTYFPSDTTDLRKLSWTSSDPSVATVDGGRIYAAGSGTARITAHSFGYYELDAVCDVTVEGCKVILYGKDQAPVETRTGLQIGDRIETLPVLPDYTDLGVTYRFMGWYSLKNPEAPLTSDNLKMRYAGGEKVEEAKLELYAYFEAESGSFLVMPLGDQYYTGSAIRPEVVVYDSGRPGSAPLVKNRDYTLTYRNNVKVSTGLAENRKPLVTVKGRGDYAGSLEVRFDIVPRSLSDGDIKVSIPAAIYNGKKIRTMPTVTYGSRKLISGTDYNVSFPWSGTSDYVQPGNYPVVITGAGNYAGSRTEYMTITNDVTLPSVTVSGLASASYEKYAAQIASVEGARPAFVLTYSKTEEGRKKNHTYSYLGNLRGVGIVNDNWLLDGQPIADSELPFAVTYIGNRSVGNAQIRIKARENMGFVGEKTFSFRITGIAMSRVQMSGVPTEYTFDGTEHRPDPELSCIVDGNRRTLMKGTDYELEYEDNYCAGRGVVYAVGKGAYTGTIYRTFRIEPCVLIAESDGGKVTTVIDTPIYYIAGGCRPEPEVYYDGVLLQKEIDYTLSWKNNDRVHRIGDPGKMPEVLIKGCGNFKGIVKTAFEILPRGLAGTSITAADVVYKEREGNYRTTVKLTDVDGTVLKAGIDYEKGVTYTYVNPTTVSVGVGKTAVRGVLRSAGSAVQAKDVVPAGTVLRVTAVGKGSYGAGPGPDGEISATYRVVRSSINDLVISVPNQIYTGRAILPGMDAMKVKKGKVTLDNAQKSAAFEIVPGSYVNNTKTGTASFVIRGIGEYGGLRTVKFKIVGKKIAK